MSIALRTSALLNHIWREKGINFFLPDSSSKGCTSLSTSADRPHWQLTHRKPLPALEPPIWAYGVTHVVRIGQFLFWLKYIFNLKITFPIVLKIMCNVPVCGVSFVCMYSFSLCLLAQVYIVLVKCYQKVTVTSIVF